METVDASQHQSSHQKATPCRSKLCWRSKLDSAWETVLQSQARQIPAMQLVLVSVVPATCWAVGSSGSSRAMLEWMFNVTSMPRECAHCKNELGSGNSALSHSHPSQLLGDFQSVSSDSVSSGTPAR